MAQGYTGAHFAHYANGGHVPHVAPQHAHPGLMALHDARDDNAALTEYNSNAQQDQNAMDIQHGRHLIPQSVFENRLRSYTGDASHWHVLFMYAIIEDISRGMDALQRLVFPLCYIPDPVGRQFAYHKRSYHVGIFNQAPMETVATEATSSEQTGKFMIRRFEAHYTMNGTHLMSKSGQQEDYHKTQQIIVSLRNTFCHMAAFEVTRLSRLATPNMGSNAAQDQLHMSRYATRARKFFGFLNKHPQSLSELLAIGKQVIMDRRGCGPQSRFALLLPNGMERYTKLKGTDSLKIVRRHNVDELVRNKHVDVAIVVTPTAGERDILESTVAVGDYGYLGPENAQGKALGNKYPMTKADTCRLYDEDQDAMVLMDPQSAWDHCGMFEDNTITPMGKDWVAAAFEQCNVQCTSVTGRGPSISELLNLPTMFGSQARNSGTHGALVLLRKLENQDLDNNRRENYYNELSALHHDLKTGSERAVGTTPREVRETHFAHYVPSHHRSETYMTNPDLVTDGKLVAPPGKETDFRDNDDERPGHPDSRETKKAERAAAEAAWATEDDAAAAARQEDERRRFYQTDFHDPHALRTRLEADIRRLEDEVVAIFDVLPVFQSGGVFDILYQRSLSPFSFLLMRPAKRYISSAAAVMVADGGVGSLFFTMPTVRTSHDRDHDIVTRHFNVHGKAVTVNPENAEVYRNAFIKQYVGGGGTQYFNPRDKMDVSFWNDVRNGQYDNHFMNGSSKSLFAVPLPRRVKCPGEYFRAEPILTNERVMGEAAVPAFAVAPSSDVKFVPFKNIWAKFWHFKAGRNAGYLAEPSHAHSLGTELCNMLLFKAFHIKSICDGANSDAIKMAKDTNKGHWRHLSGPGSKSAHEGAIF